MNDSLSRRVRDRAAGPATLISEGCKVSGMITGECDFQISGTIDGDCDLAGTVTLSRFREMDCGWARSKLATSSSPVRSKAILWQVATSR
jgi:hypothetical protein